MKTFIGVCLKLLLLLCLFFSLNTFAGDWPEFNPHDQTCVEFYYEQANTLCAQMEELQKEYYKHSEALASQTKCNPLYQYEDKWMHVWRAYSKDSLNRAKEMKISLKDFGTGLVAKVSVFRTKLRKKTGTNRPFSHTEVGEIVASINTPGVFDSPVKVHTAKDEFNTWRIPTAIGGTCPESPDKGIPSKKTPPRKNSNMVRMGLGRAPYIHETLPDGEEKFHYCEAHHMGQKNTNEHIIFFNFGIHKVHADVFHGTVKESKIDRAAFSKQKKFISKVFATRRTRKWLKGLVDKFHSVSVVAATSTAPEEKDTEDKENKEEKKEKAEKREASLADLMPDPAAFSPTSTPSENPTRSPLSLLSPNMPPRRRIKLLPGPPASDKENEHNSGEKRGRDKEFAPQHDSKRLRSSKKGTA